MDGTRVNRPWGPGWWKGEQGISFYPQLVVALLILIVTSTALVKNIYQAHENTKAEYRRMRALQELQGEVEFWKAAVYVFGINHPPSTGRRFVPLDTGNGRREQDFVLAEFSPAPDIQMIRQTGIDAYMITVSITWPEGTAMRRETLRTAVNQLR
jgi:hypothetical protein